jgi:hypothetical protein
LHFEVELAGPAPADSMMSRRMIPPLRGRIDDCTDPTVMKQIRINQLDVGEESIDDLLAKK